MWKTLCNVVSTIGTLILVVAIIAAGLVLAAVFVTIGWILMVVIIVLIIGYGIVSYREYEDSLTEG
jgi:uncharacterized membrane protein